jgi:hypothetical protein
MATDPVYRDAAVSATRTTTTAVKEAVGSFVEGVTDFVTDLIDSPNESVMQRDGETIFPDYDDIPLGAMVDPVPVRDADGKIIGWRVIGDPEVHGGAINDLANKDDGKPKEEKKEEEKEEEEKDEQDGE